MPKQRAANSDWQEMGGTITIPDGSFLTGADFDTPEPYIYITDQEGVESKLLVPKALAYFLSVHHCGSGYMRESYMNDGRREVQQLIKCALEL